MSSINLNKKHFIIFKKWVNYYFNLYKLDEYWEIEVKSVKEKEGLQNGCIDAEWYNGCAKICLITKDYCPCINNLNEDIKITAKHEVIHLMTSKLHSLAMNRYVRQSEINDAVEEVTRKLTKLLP